MTTTQTLRQKKTDNIPITMLTAFDYLTAMIIDQTDIDMVLVGDSLGNVFDGKPTTNHVTLDQIIYHTKAVKRGLSNQFLVSDMPFGCAEVSAEKTKENAIALMANGGANAIKIEVSPDNVDHAKAVSHCGIPVVAHIGFTPQHVHQLGGYKVQGRSNEQATALIDLAKTLDDYGVCALVLEMVPAQLAKTITTSISAPTIGIGAGNGCDGQVLVTQDLLGLTPHTPKFVKQYTDFQTQAKAAISQFSHDVKTRQFPDDTHSF